MDFCKEKKKITRLVDGELSQQERDAVLRHTTQCDVCRKEYEALKSLDGMLLDAKSVAPSADFAQKFWKKAKAVEQKKTHPVIFQDFFRTWQPTLLARGAAAAAAAVVVIAAGSFIFYQAGFGPSQTQVPGHSDLQFVENIDLYSDFEIINNLELLENWEEIIQLEEI